MNNFDLIVIGAGPAGYVAAIRGAQKGMKVACIEKGETLGGTCLNVGCIPSKALLHSTEYFDRIASEGEEHGILAENLRVDLKQMMERKEQIVKSLTQGIAYLFEKNNITKIKGAATLLSENRISVDDQEYGYKNLILATGSVPIELPQLPFDEETILSSTGALSLKKIPSKLLLVGAGVIGLELGSVYNRLGTEIEVVEMLDRPCPPFDQEISKLLLKLFKKQGFSFHFKAKVTEGKSTKEGVVLTLDSGKTLTADAALIAIGRKPYYEGLGVEERGVTINQQRQIIVDDNFQTSVPNIYAIGDLIDGPMLAHKASEEGIALVDYLAGEKSRVNYLAIPNVMYTWPEVATVGLNQEEAVALGLEILIGKAPLKSNARARCSGDPEGMVKLIGEKKSGRLLGMHLLAPNASEMIGEGAIAIEKRLTVDELAHLPHAHPTVSESIKEAALAIKGQSIHF
ncbi:MAG: Dihydrolipoyl dehydrogenase [Chlamydiales bacterium]|nr:Dihydrolipoyl dehydrogenase [Chlamydiales bacterium]MCH9620528.1 Dihydrolipoyl dehydrogenase [Chlamydiales bacterium]MCH9623031.1 Dihydrolipoyl dehydrogenase [Chlamydiales bacterium]